MRKYLNPSFIYCERTFFNKYFIISNTGLPTKVRISTTTLELILSYFNKLYALQTVH